MTGKINGWSIETDRLVAYGDGILMTITLDQPVPPAERLPELERRALQEANDTDDQVEIRYNEEAANLTGQAIIVRISHNGMPALVNMMKSKRPGGSQMTLAQIAESITPQGIMDEIIMGQALMEKQGKINPGQQPG